MPLPAAVASRSSHNGATITPIAEAGMQALVKVVLLVVNCRLPFELALKDE